MQLHMDPLAVQVAVKIKQMRLNRGCASVYKSRLFSNIGRRRESPSIKQHTGRIYTVGRQRHFTRERQVYRGDAHFMADRAFASVEALKEAIALNIRQTRDYFSPVQEKR